MQTLAARNRHPAAWPSRQLLAAGMALGAALMRLPWRLHGICLAGDAEYYAAQQRSLVEAFCRQYASDTLHPGAVQPHAP